MDWQALAELMANLPRAYGDPPARAVLRSAPEDFVVDEDLGFEPSGSGEHCWLYVEKRNSNTDYVARALARYAGVAARDVGYGGLKDRRAVTRQWFSLPLSAGAAPVWEGFNRPGEWQVLRAVRHGRKLRRGTLSGNRFTLVLRELSGERAAIEARLERLSAEGFPNYFTEQRFGRDNLAQAAAMLSGETRVKDAFERGIYLSAARSALFNAVLAARVRAGNWSRLLPGEAVMLAGSNSFFCAEQLDAELEERCRKCDIAPSGPLWGTGDSPARGMARSLEATALAPWREVCDALARAELRQARRPLLVYPLKTHWRFVDGGALELSFGLPAGSYATALLREVASAVQDMPY